MPERRVRLWGIHQAPPAPQSSHLCPEIAGFSGLSNRTAPAGSKSFFDPGPLGLEFCSGSVRGPPFFDPGPLGLEFCSGSVRGPHGAGLQSTQGNVRAAAPVEAFRDPTPEPRAI